MVDNFLKLLLLVSPIVFTSGISIERFEIIFFHFGVIGLFVASLLDTPKRKSIPIAKEIALFLCLCFANIAIHSFNFLSIGIFLNIFLFCLALNIVYQHMKEPKEYYKYIIVAALINIIVYLAQRFYFNFLPYFPVEKVAGVIEWGGLFGTAPRFANYIAIITPIIFSTLWFAIPILAILFNQLLPIVLFIIMAIYRTSIAGRLTNRKFVYSVVGIAFAFFVFIYNKKIIESIDLRLFRVYKPILTEICNAPLTGHGLGSCYAAFGTTVFNSLIPFIYDVGVLGLALFGYTLYNIRKYFKWDIGSLSLVALIIVMMLDSPIEAPRLWFTIIFIIAAFFYQKEDVYESNQ